MELLAPSSAAATVNISTDTCSKGSNQRFATVYNETVSDFEILTGPANQEDLMIF